MVEVQRFMAFKFNPYAILGWCDALDLMSQNKLRNIVGQSRDDIRVPAFTRRTPEKKRPREK